YLDDGTLCFLVGDVSGKGMPAALFMARTKSLIRLTAELMRAGYGAAVGPAEIVARVNRELSQDNVDMMFVTLFFAMLRPQTGGVGSVNAGPHPPYLLNGASVEPIEDAKGAALGVRANAAYRTGERSIPPGGAIYLYTDGVTEAEDGAHSLFSEPRL